MTRERKSTRMQGYDYSSDNLYFVTSCVQNRICCLGEIVMPGRDPALQNNRNDSVGPGRDLALQNHFYYFVMPGRDPALRFPLNNKSGFVHKMLRNINYPTNNHIPASLLIYVLWSFQIPFNRELQGRVATRPCNSRLNGI